MVGQGDGLPMSRTPRSGHCGAARPQPERSDDFVHLSLDRLRTYRQALSDEENRVSYWRRIVQARLDLVRAGSTGDPKLAENLKQVLSQAHRTTGRTALVTVVPVDDIPPLPDLAGLWERDARPGDEAYNEQFINDLARPSASSRRTAPHCMSASVPRPPN